MDNFNEITVLMAQMMIQEYAEWDAEFNMDCPRGFSKNCTHNCVNLAECAHKTKMAQMAETLRGMIDGSKPEVEPETKTARVQGINLEQWKIDFKCGVDKLALSARMASAIKSSVNKVCESRYPRKYFQDNETSKMLNFDEWCNRMLPGQNEDYRISQLRNVGEKGVDEAIVAIMNYTSARVVS
jgi:hypothetical protein